MNLILFNEFLRCVIDECSDVSEKRTPIETLQNLPTARHKIPTDKLNNKTRNCTKSKRPQIPLQLRNMNSTLRTNRQQC